MDEMDAKPGWLKGVIDDALADPIAAAEKRGRIAGLREAIERLESNDERLAVSILERMIEDQPQ